MTDSEWTEDDFVEFPLTYIKWLDSTSYSDQAWHRIESHDVKCIPIHSVGFLIHEDDEKVTLSMNISEEGFMCGDMTIPKSAILERGVLDLAKG